MIFFKDNLTRLYHGDARNMSELNQYGSSGSAIIKLLDFVKAYFPKLYFLWRDGMMAVASSSFFASPQFQQGQGLLSLYSQIRHKFIDTLNSLPIRYAPSIKWFAVFSRWLLNSAITIKIIIKQIHNIKFDLLQAYLFRKDWVRGISHNPHMIGATLNGEIPITIQTASQICFNNFFHNYIITYPVAGVKKGGDENGGEVLPG